MGYRKMMCILISESLDENKILQLIDKSVLEARINKEMYINILFIANSIKNVFRYRDIFTRYIDIGIRLYITKELTELRNIIQKCEHVFISVNDEYAKSIVSGHDAGRIKII